jgi:hypothetical protein
MTYVRPDFVGRTSVLQTIVGYQPVANAQGVAQQFVTAPYYATGPGQFAGAHSGSLAGLAAQLGSTTNTVPSSVRPDFVGYTSVLQNIVGYQPVANAGYVAEQFTTAPYYSTGSGQFAGYGLGRGFGETAKMSFGERVRMFFYKIRLRNASKKANAVAAEVAALPAGNTCPMNGQPQGPVAGQSAHQQAGYMLTAGMAASGVDIMPPHVAKPPIVAGAQLTWDTSGAPFDFAEHMRNRVVGGSNCR